MKILIVRFKQIGDSVLATPICESLRKTYPDARIDYVVYEHIAPLFLNHPAIDNVISITKAEQKNPFKYAAKVWKVTRAKYDIIIDIMSTPKSELFTLFGRSAEYRIGRWKPKRGYTYTHSTREPKVSRDKVDKFLHMLKPLEEAGIDIKYDTTYRVVVTDEEKNKLKDRMIKAGLNFDRPVFAFAINSRRPEKIWNPEYMKEIIMTLLDKYNAQGIFYYSPAEREFAKNMHRELENREDIFSNIETKSIRELAMLLSNCDMFLGNEGGPRHIAQGLDIPSFAIFSPRAEKKEWLSNANDRHRGIEPDDIIRETNIETPKTSKEEYELITPERVLPIIDEMISKYVRK
ncbi:glycosyltransferase family 9 protein [Psychrilyobacter atlanticus]|uniref:glycosyltransferase family 9 protein n=1 Tax=Psychrilyobacter atlanticus TaxID=271091 RepID=UPI0004228C32|nr:glycosyltransferase family 9 protein [Psychrilyobacter atlanticus]